MALNESIPAALPTRTGTGIANLTSGTPESTTNLIHVHRLRQRFAMSEQMAALIVSLAGLGLREIR